MDRRLLPSNGRVAAAELEGKVSADRFVTGEVRQTIGDPFLYDAPNGKRDRQLLFGDRVRVLETRAGWHFVQALHDGYVGYTDAHLSPPISVTHRVNVRTGWAYPEPDFKLPAVLPLHLNSALHVLERGEKWSKFQTPDGQTACVPTVQIASVSDLATDPVSAVECMLGTPYVWAGNSGFGLDCSGLVQAGMRACGLECPGDSDLQERALGRALPAGSAYQRGDLLFWKGHVAWVADSQRILHANAHHMAVAYEPIGAAIARIQDQCDGPVTSHRRPEFTRPGE